MPRDIALRPDFCAAYLRCLTRGSREAAQLGSVTLQVVRSWVVRFNAAGPDGLRDRKAPGPPPLMTQAHRQALAAQVDRGPILAIHGVVRWQLCDLGQWLWEAIGHAKVGVTTKILAAPSGQGRIRLTLTRQGRARFSGEDGVEPAISSSQWVIRLPPRCIGFVDCVSPN